MKNHEKKLAYRKFCTALRELRREFDITQSELARLLDKPQSYVSKYESGEKRLDFLEVRSICMALGISLSDFVLRFEKTFNSQAK